MKRSFIVAAGVAMIAATLSGPAQPQQPPRGDRDAAAAGKKSGAPDEKFLKKAAGDGRAEVELGRLAGERGASDSVKQFGRRMVSDHGKAVDELAQLAPQKGVALPGQPDARHKKLYDRLSKLSGEQFDREYMKAMVKDHDADVKAFEREARRSKDADVKAWAEKTLAVLQQHQQQAHQIEAAVKGSAAASPGAKPSR